MKVERLVSLHSRRPWLLPDSRLLRWPVQQAGQAPAGTVAIDNDDIGGVVTGRRPEAGVWVIAETRDLPTRLIKTVVTDDQGRYLVPDLPERRTTTSGSAATASSIRRRSRRARQAAEPDGRAGAEREGGGGNTIRRSIGSRCFRCRPRATSRHRAKGQRHFAERQEPGRVDSAGRQHGRLHRLPSDGQQGDARDSREPRHVRDVSARVGSPDSVRPGRRRHERPLHAGRPRARLAMYARLDRSDCGRRAADGHAAASAGPERNVVVTMWDWADPKVYLHDEIATDKRNPTVNANGPIYGALEESADYLPVVDPTRNTASQVKLTVRDPKTPSAANTPPAQPSPYWGDEAIWTSQTSTHSFAMDGQGRVWAASRIRQNRRCRGVRPDRIIRRPRRSRSRRAAGSSRCTIRRPSRRRRSTPASARAT